LTVSVLHFGLPHYTRGPWPVARGPWPVVRGPWHGRCWTDSISKCEVRTMSEYFDEFSRSLAEKSVPRRQSLRLLGAALAGTLLGPLGARNTWAAGPDACKQFCNQCPKSRRSQCVADCRACGNDTSRLCGYCSDYYGRYNLVCTDPANDARNCGACGHNCWSDAGANEETACIDGTCQYLCREGAVRCDGECRFLDSDISNCGACGYVCDEPGPYETAACVNGRCEYGCVYGAIVCDGACTPVWSDPNNCGACGHVCGGTTPYCAGGACTDCAWGTICDGLCTDLGADNANCGACGFQCPSGTSCIDGVCEGWGDDYDYGWPWG
jgi:hypothetical protein